MIHYVQGDATNPQGSGAKFIVHISNNQDGWGRGFVVAISKKWPQPEAVYHETAKILGGKRILGTFDRVVVGPYITVFNMIAQDGIQGRGKSGCLVNFKALRECLQEIGDIARQCGATIHAPRIGAGLGGAKWNQIEPILNSTLHGLEVYIYDLPGDTSWKK